MDCDLASEMVELWLDGELDPASAMEVERHVGGCEDCRQRVEAGRAVRAAVRNFATRHAAPASLRAALASAPDKADDDGYRSATVTPLRPRRRGWWLPGVSLAGLAASLLLVFIQPSAEDRLVDDVVAGHVRSLLVPEHLVDVPTSDQHTVKPWFNGRLDVAPPVVDLTAQGFTLLGGRLDYVDAKPVAAIVYRRRVHVINLFCAPAPGAARHGATMESLQGFNVRSWTENGLSLWAVSDINPDELAEFGEKFEAALRQ